MTDKIALNINPDELTIGDMEDFEDFYGKPINEAIKPVPTYDDDGNKVFDDDGRPVMETRVPAKALRGLVWIVLRKSNPDFTVDKARDVTVTSLVLSAPAEAEQGNG